MSDRQAMSCLYSISGSVKTIKFRNLLANSESLVTQSPKGGKQGWRLDITDKSFYGPGQFYLFPFLVNFWSRYKVSYHREGKYLCGKKQTPGTQIKMLTLLRILAWPVFVVRTVWIYLQLCPGPSLIYLSVYANARMEMFGYSHPVKTLTTNTFMTRAVKCLTKLFIRFNVQSNKCVGWKHIFCHLNLFKTQDNCRICMLSFPRFQSISWPAPSWRPGTGDWLAWSGPGHGSSRRSRPAVITWSWCL